MSCARTPMPPPDPKHDVVCGENSTCLPTCGDGNVNAAAGETCDEGSTDTSECNFAGGAPPHACTLSRCGDGYVNSAAGEACDGGNDLPGDGCDASCGLTLPAFRTKTVLSAGRASPPVVATDGSGLWLAVWASTANHPGHEGVDYDVYVSRSVDNGVTWDEPEAVNSNAGQDIGDDLDPDVAADGNGGWVVVWHSTTNLNDAVGDDSDIFFSTSIDSAQSWSPVAVLSGYAGGDTGIDEAAHIAVSDSGVWLASWQSDEPPGASRASHLDILAATSVDGGSSWSFPVPINSNWGPATNRDNTAPSVVSLGGASWLAAWHTTDPNNGWGGDVDILVSKSLDSGGTWSPAAHLNPNALTDRYDDWNPQLFIDTPTNWVAVWHSDNQDINAAFDDDFDIFVSTSADEGVTWTLQDVVNDYGTMDTSPDIEPVISGDHNGTLVVAWASNANISGAGRDDTDILFSVSTDGTQNWAPADLLNMGGTEDNLLQVSSIRDERPGITTNGAGAWVASWGADQSRGYLTASSDLTGAWAAPTRVAWSQDMFTAGNDGAQIVVEPSGTWTLYWGSADPGDGSLGADSDTFWARSSNAGEDWTEPTHLNADAATDTRIDVGPKIGTASGGHWVSVWSAIDRTGAWIGNDWDILSAHSTDYGVTWSVPTLVNDYGTVDISRDSFPQVVSDGNGISIVVWESAHSLGDTIGWDDDILMARSTDAGQSWSASDVLVEGARTDSADDRNPRIATDGAGTWVAVWWIYASAASTVVVSRSVDAGVTWAAPTPVDGRVPTTTRSGGFPHVATDSAGVWAVTWLSGESQGGTLGSDSDIFLAISTDDALTWSPSALVNHYAATDSVQDAFPSVAGHRNGTWVVVWSSTHTLGGTLGSDGDNFFAVSKDTGNSWSDAAPLSAHAIGARSADREPSVFVTDEARWFAHWAVNGMMMIVPVAVD